MGNVSLFIGDIRDCNFVKSVFDSNEFDGIIHLAAVSRVVDGENNPELCRTINVGGMQNVLTSAESHGCPWIIFGSSREVYGEAANLPASEDCPLKPINIYGFIKTECEEMLRKYSETNNVSAISLRFSNVYGSWFDFTTRVTPLFLRNILSGKTVEINGGSQLFDFTHIDDTVDGIIKAVEKLSENNVLQYSEYHILTGTPHSLQELIEIMEKVTGKTAKLKYTPARDYDVNRFYGNPEKAEKELGYKSKISLESGIKLMVKNLTNRPLRVLKVIHGFPPYYMAGSEVYSYNLVNELSKKTEVGVFTRVENPFIDNYKPEYSVEKGVLINRVNNTSSDYILKDKYVNKNIDVAFKNFLLEFKPDVVHIGHLSHLSTNIVKITKAFKIPVVMTIHDFWMFCFRGQLIDYEGKVCSGPSNEKCMMCLRDRLKEHAEISDLEDYRKHMQEIIDNIDLFIAPSEHVMNFYISMGVNKNKIKYMRYGFDTERIKYRKRKHRKGDGIRFAFTGRVIPVKGISAAIKAFSKVKSESASFTVYGDAGKYEKYLSTGDKRLRFSGPYHTNEVNKILDEIDVLVVPSEWYEVSPLVIQEALLAGIPVITSNLGGMKELIQNGRNGYLVQPGNVSEIAEIMQKIVDNPEMLNLLNIDPSVVVDIKNHVHEIISIYEGLVK